MRCESAPSIVWHTVFSACDSLWSPLSIAATWDPTLADHCPLSWAALSTEQFLIPGRRTPHIRHSNAHTFLSATRIFVGKIDIWIVWIHQSKDQRSFPRTKSDATGGSLVRVGICAVLSIIYHYLISTLHLHTQCGRRRCDMSSLRTINLSSFFLRYIIHIRICDWNKQKQSSQ